MSKGGDNNNPGKASVSGEGPEPEKKNTLGFRPAPPSQKPSDDLVGWAKNTKGQENQITSKPGTGTNPFRQNEQSQSPKPLGVPNPSRQTQTQVPNPWQTPSSVGKPNISENPFRKNEPQATKEPKGMTADIKGIVKEQGKKLLKAGGKLLDKAAKNAPIVGKGKGQGKDQGQVR